MLSECEKILYDLDSLLEESFRAERVFRRYLNGVAKTLGVKRVSLMVLDEGAKELYIQESHGLFPELKGKIRIRVGEGIAGTVAAKGRGLVVGDARSHALVRSRGTGKSRPGGFISVPIRLKGKVYGVLNVSEKSTKGMLGPDDLKKLEIFGMQLALILENERLQGEIRALEKKPVQDIAEASHDFRIPLTCVQEALRLVRNAELGPVTDSQKEFLNLAERNVNRMMNTFDHLIAMAGQVKRQKNSRRRTDITSLVEDVAKEFEPKAMRKKIRLETLLPEKRIYLQTDPSKIHEVMINLVDNALKFSESGTRVRLSLAQDKSKVRFQVDDEGPGLTAAEKKMIFNKTASLEHARQGGAREGHGLGLAISQDILKSLGGKIGHRSQEGRGSTFFVELKR